MKTIILLLGFLTTSVFAQDAVQVMCGQNAITAKIQKEIVETAGFEMSDVHMNDRSCEFTDEDNDFFLRTISPLSSCGTHFIANDTHVEFTNSISTVDTGPTYPYGVVVGSRDNPNVLSARISCTYRIDLNVSVMFIPNITIVPIKIPDAFGIGEFQAAMAIYTDNTYRTPYLRPPSMEPDDVLYIGVTLIDQASSDIYLLVQECWGTISSDPSASPKYPLVEEGCSVASAADGAVRVTQNGIGHQAMWNSPVFKFVGDDEAHDNVWLHCDLQLCINKQCEPTCARRRRRALGEAGSFWGPDDFTGEQHIISLGPFTRLRVTEISTNDTKTTYVDVEPGSNPFVVKQPSKTDARTGSWSPAVIAVLGVLGGLALICVALALVAVIARMRLRPANSGVDLAGMPNKAYTP
ncbi:uromodulin-like [Clavelina lepadiformis]|uniref:uromodulin-like n=1 Tax=Clavelina lepadiformis TaxID=159417 RepID=UPI0040437CC5